MGKNVALVCAGLLMSLAGFSQIELADFSVGVAGNYTMYKGSRLVSLLQV